MEDRIPYKDWHVLLSRQGDLWVADIIPKGQSSTSLVIHGGTMAAVVNAAFAVIDAQERDRVAS
jgi:hypothetical protein